MRRTAVELTVEREVVGEDGVTRRYRLSATFAPEGPDAADDPKLLGDRFRALSQELDRTIPAGAVAPVRAERSLAELVETYRPRQRELLDLLLAEGEITQGELDRLSAYLQERSAGQPSELPIAERPLAAAPLAADRAPATVRPIEELLRLYHIESLRQAGAVRARRQISYEEYMSLKRHFAATEAGGGTAEAPPGG